MSGFVGYLNGEEKIDHQTTIEKMSDMIIHRGPDGGGTYTDENSTFKAEKIFFHWFLRL